MKRLFFYCCLLFLFISNTSYVSAKSKKIPLDNSYISGVITESSGQENDYEVVQIYSFELDNPGTIDIHFISHIRNMGFMIKDADENIILDEEISEYYSPQDYPLVLDSGEYTLHIIEIDSSTGDYKFKIKYSPYILNTHQNAENLDGDDTPREIILEESFKDYFPSKKDHYAMNNIYILNISISGEYIFSSTSDIELDLSIKDIDETEIVEQTIYPDNKFEDIYTLEQGEYYITCSSYDAGTYQILFEKLVETEDTDLEETKNPDSKETSSIETQTETPIVESERKNIGNIFKNFFKGIFSPNTFIGAILVTVIGGIILWYLTHKNSDDDL